MTANKNLGGEASPPPWEHAEPLALSREAGTLPLPGGILASLGARQAVGTLMGSGDASLPRGTEMLVTASKNLGGEASWLLLRKR